MASHASKLSKLEASLAAAVDSAERIDLMYEIAFLIHRHDPDRALQLATESRDLAVQIGDRDRRARSMLVIAQVYELTSRYEEGIAAIHEVIATFRRTGNRRDLANAHNTLGLFMRNLSNLPEALRNHLAADEFYKEQADTAGRIVALNNIGAIHEASGNRQEALKAYLTSYELAVEFGDTESTAAAISNIGNIYYLMESFEHALKYYRQALELTEQNDLKYGTAHVLGNISSIYKHNGDTRQALEALTRAHSIMLELGDKRYQGSLLVKIAMVRQLRGDIDGAVNDFNRAVELVKGIGAKGNYAEALYRMGTMLVEEGRPEEALPTLREALEIADEIGAAKVRCGCHHQLALALCYTGRANEATPHWEEHTTLLKEVNSQEQGQAIAEIKAQYDMKRVIREKEFQEEQAQYHEHVAEQRSKELATTAMHLMRKNSLLQNLKEEILRLSDDSGSNDSPEGNAAIRALIGQIDEGLRSEDDWQRFEEMYRLVHHDFIRTLSELFPALSGTELKVCALMNINLSNKEIAEILYVSVRTIESHRYRIRKKLNIPSDTNLSAYFAGLSASSDRDPESTDSSKSRVV